MLKIKMNIQRFNSTNKTTNYDLSQYVNDDKPTYLGDYNSDMLKIDTQMKANADNIASNVSATEVAKTTADTALGNANTAQTTANTANNTANSALAKSLSNESDIKRFNLTNIEILTNIISSQGEIVSNGLKVATNSDGSIGKIYGFFSFNTTDGQGKVVELTTQPTNLRPKTPINIQCAGINQDNLNRLNQIDLNISTNGVIKISFYSNQSDSKINFIFPCVYFMEDFGDTPTNN